MYIGDLHIHSKYSRATSRDCTPEYLDLWARKKGIDIVGTGDFTHPAWREELKEKLQPAEEGLYLLKPEYRIRDGAAPDDRLPRFVVTGEISSIYKKMERVRKVHSLLLLPGLEEADRLARRLELIGNIHSDGRPILGLDCRDLLEIMLETCPTAVYVPAHIWTPHFSLFGAFSGFDRIEDCYEDLTPYVHALETGLSSDPPMNWRISALDSYQLISNSDAHSPAKLGREATLFDSELSYTGLAEAVNSGEGLAGTLEFFPEEGKYHFDGHRKCCLCVDPREAAKYGNICPVCGKRLTIGVLHRVEELADREEGYRLPSARPFESLVPLPEVIASSTGSGVGGKKVQERYEKMLWGLGSEFSILRSVPVEDIRKLAGPLIAEGIKRLREGRVARTPGFDGEYGTIQLLDALEISSLQGQISLFTSEELRSQQKAQEDLDRHCRQREGSVTEQDFGEKQPADGNSAKQRGAHQQQVEVCGKDTVQPGEVRPENRRPEGVGGEGCPRENRRPEGVEGEGCPRENRRPEGVEGEGCPRENRRPEGVEGKDCPRENRETENGGGKGWDAEIRTEEMRSTEIPIGQWPLNHRQQEAVCAEERAVAVIAGPGSGKTKTLLEHLLYLMENRKVKPGEITAVTFTNKAAEELRSRLDKLPAGKRQAKQVQIGTFHSICSRILKERGMVFHIADEGLQTELAEETREKFGLKISAANFLRELSLRKSGASLYGKGGDNADGGIKENTDCSADIVAENNLKYDSCKDTRENPEANMMEAAAYYQERLSASGALDYDDLLLETLKLFETAPTASAGQASASAGQASALAGQASAAADQASASAGLAASAAGQASAAARPASAEQVSREGRTPGAARPDHGRYDAAKRFSYLLVDEFQDINVVQYRLLRAWNQGGKELFVIGDPDQSIYGFRGSDASCFERLAEDYPELRRISLLHNYRSTPEILSGALCVISRNEGPRRLMEAVREHGRPIRIVTAADERNEAIFVAKEINRLIGGIDMLDVQENHGRSGWGVRSFSDIAVLYRTHRQARLLEYCLRQEGIPYVVAGREDFLLEDKVRGTLFFFRNLLNPEDALAREQAGRLLFPEARDKAEAQLDLLARKYGGSVRRGKPVKLLEEWAADIKSGEDAALNRLADMSVMYPDMETLLENLSIGEEGDIRRSGSRKFHSDSVALMTLHGAKGLEFPAVFLYGARRGTIPPVRAVKSAEAAGEGRGKSGSSPLPVLQGEADVCRGEGCARHPKEDLLCDPLAETESGESKCEAGEAAAPALPARPEGNRGLQISNIQEERRLFYVGMTRAVEELIITASGEESMFLREIPDGAAVRESAGKEKASVEAVQLSLFDFMA